MSEKRRYTFTNFMLRSIQQGVQADHAGDELTNKYVYADHAHEHSIKTRDFLKDWSLNHKTVIYLNGGFHGDMVSLDQLLSYNDLEFGGVILPWAKFHEDEYTLGGLLTSISIVLPEEIYNAQSYKKMLEPVFNVNEFMRKYPRNDFEKDFFWENLYTGDIVRYSHESPMGRFIGQFLKNTGLAT